MRARTLTLGVVIVLMTIASIGCDVRRIVGPIANTIGCDNTLQIRVWHNGNVVQGACVWFEEADVQSCTDNTGMTSIVCCGSNRIMNISVSYGNLSPTTAAIGINVGANIVDVGF